MKKDKLKLSESPRRSHWQNVVRLFNPLLWVTSLFTAVGVGGYLYPEYVDPILLWSLVGCGTVSASLALVAGCCRLIEYRRVLAIIRQKGVLSYYNLNMDPLYVQLGATRGRRKVLTAALGTLSRVPADEPTVSLAYKTKRIPRYRAFIAWGWWYNTFHPMRVL